MARICGKRAGRIFVGGVLVAMGAWWVPGEVRAQQPVLEEQWSQFKPSGQTKDWGASVDEAGDVDGDGYDDVIVGSNGHAHVYRGSASGLEASPSWSVAGGSGEKSDINFGTSVAGVGDVNDDSYDDVLVGDTGKFVTYTNGSEVLNGRAYLYLGSSSGLSQTADVVLDGSPSHFGGRVSAAGDVDGDGHDDVLVAAVTAGGRSGSNCPSSERNHHWSVHLYRGRDDGLSETASWSVTADQTDSCFGYAIADAGDVDDDGYDDVLVGAPMHDLNQGGSSPKKVGEVYLYAGSASGLDSSPRWTREHLQMDLDGLWFGNSVAGIGDVDGDGYDDVAIHGVGDYGEGLGRHAFVFRGSSAGLGTMPSKRIAPETFASNGSHELGVSPAGDVNDDGYDDMLFQFAPGTVAMYHGSSAGVVDPSAWRVGQGAQTLRYGRPGSHAGDVDGDGFADIVTRSESAFRPGTNDTSEVHVFHGATNPPPEAQSQSVVADRGHPRTVTLEGTDLHDDPLSFSIVSGPDRGSVFGLQSAGRSSAEITYAPPSSAGGSDAFTFEVADPYGHAATGTVEVTIESPPSFVPPTPTDSKHLSVGETLAFTVAAEDPDGDAITYGVEPLPDGASIDEETGQFEWTPGPGQAGTRAIDVTASDGVATIRRQIGVRVDSVATDVGVDGGDMDGGSPDDAGGETGPGGDVGDGGDADDGGSEDAASDVGVDAARPDATESDEGDAAVDVGYSPPEDAAPGADGTGEGDRARRSGAEGCGCSTPEEGPPVGGVLWIVIVGIGIWGRKERRGR